MSELNSNHHKINYIEFPAHNLEATTTFFNEVFGWEFTNYGPDYTAVNNQDLDGGFYRCELSGRINKGAALIVFYSSDLESTEQLIVSCGGQIVQDIFEFPGGRRFHFTEPSGNEMAVWSE